VGGPQAARERSVEMRPPTDWSGLLQQTTAEHRGICEVQVEEEGT
jgi:hypothetical protein